MALTALAPPSVSPLSAPRTFVEFDDRVMAAEPGALVVRAPASAHAALLAHAARRLRAGGSHPIVAATRDGAPCVVEIASRLGVKLVCEPEQCADLIVPAALAERAAVVAVLPSANWDRAVLTELVRSSRFPLVLVTDGAIPASWDVTTFELSAELGAAEKLRWLSAVAEDAQAHVEPTDVATLEAWWSNARRASQTGLDVSGLSDEARTLLAALACAGRSLRIETVQSVGGLHEAHARGLVRVDRGLVSVAVECDGHASDLARDAAPSLRGDIGRALIGGFEPDPWAYARAAELLLEAGEGDEADAAAHAALRAVQDATAVHELGQRWFKAVEPVSGELGLTLRTRAAERALAIGEAGEAQRWCESAAALAPGSSAVGLLMGKSLMQLGDLVAAKVALGRAEQDAKDDDARSRVAAELAEVAYLRGNIDESTREAERAIALAGTTSSRLAGRNTLGKILLSQAKWDEADAHFAEDAMVAQAEGIITAELRARLNRAIALMSKGLLDDARAALTRVLEDGAAHGEDRARAHALGNLAVIAYRRHEYGEALALWEQTVRFRQALRGRIATARTIANLAELRMRLGLVDHAEHAIAFGRRLLGRGTTAARASHFGVVAARIALARRDSELARREVDAAILDGEIAQDKDFLGEAHRVAARVALEDGDLPRMEEALGRAEKLATNDRAKAEVAILRALQKRARGDSAIDAATDALTLARTSGEEDLLAEIHALVATLHRELGNVQAAQAHCGRAIAVRDQVAGSLSPEIRAAYLAKPEIVALSRLQAALLAQDEEMVEEAPRTLRAEPRAADAQDREMVGDDPQMRVLAASIRKVARANSTILIRGESGTGKELVAAALHRASDRADGPLVSVNCAALVETLLLSELFGHEKGAFTGASSRRRGRFEMAEGGTLFLDEIGDISARTQVALLRVLQEKTFERVGGTAPIRANVHVICATHRDLKAMVERGEFREDLYYRLRGITLEVPALRNRMGDLPKLAEHLLARVAQERGDAPKTLSPDALDLLARHKWPGNIRELENVLRAVSLFAEGDVIHAADLIDNVDELRSIATSGPTSQPPLSIRASLLPSPPPSFVSASLPSGVDCVGDDEESELPVDEANATAVAYAHVRQGTISLSDMKRQIERDCIQRALTETKGNITRAAALLGMKRPRLSQLVKQYGLAAASEGQQ